MGHLSLKHLGPFKNNFMPSRRQRRHTGPLYLAIFLLTSDVDRFTGLLLPSSRSVFCQGSATAIACCPLALCLRYSALAPRSPISQLPNYSITQCLDSSSLWRPAPIVRDGR